jgi:hypothetical protein
MSQQYSVTAWKLSRDDYYAQCQHETGWNAERQRLIREIKNWQLLHSDRNT